MYVAIDDTDGRDGGCTTAQVIPLLKTHPNLVLLEPPRLIRLNPNVPWKTRGNGAVAMRLGHPNGHPVQVGEVDGEPLYYYPEGNPAKPEDIDEEKIFTLIKEEGATHQDAEPCLVLMETPPTEDIYWQAVTTFIPPATTKKLKTNLPSHKTKYVGSGRSEIGCLAAIAWQPTGNKSYELLGYRPEAWIGQPREFDETPLKRLDEKNHTFCTWDPENQVLACIPNTPCPVSMGLRGENYDDMLHKVAPTFIKSAENGEGYKEWVIFQSNQASGDHIVEVTTLSESEPLMNPRLTVTITEQPQTQQGGHVKVQAKDKENNPLHLLAFEPTKTFRDEVRKLIPGDEVCVQGAQREGQVIQLEKIKVTKLAENRKRIKPACCKKAMQNKGKNTFRCKQCKTRKTAQWQVTPRNTQEGWIEPPIMSRRHLHRSNQLDAKLINKLGE